jgi:hypothetical protein
MSMQAWIVVQQFYTTSMNSECSIVHSWNLGCPIQGSDIVFAQNMLVMVTYVYVMGWWIETKYQDAEFNILRVIGEKGGLCIIRCCLCCDNINGCWNVLLCLSWEFVGGLLVCKVVFFGVNKQGMQFRKWLHGNLKI